MLSDGNTLVRGPGFELSTLPYSCFFVDLSLDQPFVQTVMTLINFLLLRMRPTY